MIKARINNKHTFSIEKKGKDYIVNGTIHQCDIQKIDTDFYLLQLNNRSFSASITRNDRQLIITINQRDYHFDIQDENDMILERLGINTKTIQLHDQLKAPMPGLIVDILVNKNDEIKSGQPLIILKAMKMENIIKSPHDGVITDIFVKKDQKIEKDAVMIQF